MINRIKKSRKIETPLSRLIIAVVFILFGIVSSVNAAPLNTLVPENHHPRKCKDIVKVLEHYHYTEKELNNALSETILDLYINRLDPGKTLFNELDISMMNRFKYQLDDDLEKGILSPAYQIFNLYLTRAAGRLNHILTKIETWEHEFDFTKDDTLVIDDENRQWLKDYPSLKTAWDKELKNHIITLILNGKTPEKITEELRKIYSNRKKRLLQTNSNDVFQIYMNSVASSFDPHTQYYPPRLAEDFNIHMSLSLEGIGAVLQSEYEYTKVVRLIPKGPADKSKLLMPGDKIIGVGQGKKGEIKDTIGLRLDSVVNLIRGPKNSIVRLKIIPAKESDTTKTIHIKRDTVKLEDQSAQKKIIELTRNNQNLKIGIIELPSFYSDFRALNNGDKNYRSVTRDVKNILAELNKEKIDGLIIDLRDNGGGSLQEAYEMTGLFLKTGPIVQVKDKFEISEHADNDSGIYYTGPLIVLINRMSASASEIFAGAIKDYRRGVIVGSRSFGKGTVQNMQWMDRKGDSKLKLTVAKFYRISGDSTQHKGVIPDLKYLRFHKIEDTGESAQKGALPWDKIPKTYYRPYPVIPGLNQTLIRAYDNRVLNDPDLIYLKNRIDLSEKKSNQSKISLNLEQRKQRKAEYKLKELEIENKYLSAIGKQELSEFDPEKAAFKEFKQMMMKQTHQIMADLVIYTRKNSLSWN